MISSSFFSSVKKIHIYFNSSRKETSAYQGRKLKCNNLVNACYSRDGVVTIKISDRSKAIKVYHMNDLLNLFPDFDFDDNEPFHDASPDVSAQSMY